MFEAESQRWQRVTLSDEVVRLAPLDEAYVDGLMRAQSESRETYGFSTVPGTEEGMRKYVAFAHAEWERGDGLAFATIDAQRDVIVGSTRFTRAERWAWAVEPIEGRCKHGIDGVEIGYTWLAPSAQRTHVNTSAKILMMDYAFDCVDVRRVMLKTDARNERSRRAIERLGCAFDGVVRAQMQGADGQVRNTAMFSMLKNEWPAARATLMHGRQR